MKGDTKSPIKELNALAKSQDNYDKKLVATNKQLEKFSGQLDKSGEKASKNAQRIQTAQQQQSQAAVDGARRQREAIEATGKVTKANLRVRLAAIDREKQARLRQLALEQKFAKTSVDRSRIRNQADQVRHSSQMARLRTEQAAQQNAARAEQARTAALARAAGGITVAAIATDKLADRSFRLANVQANLPFSIDKARESTLGLVSDFDLMQQAITANRLGVAKTSTDFANMAETAVKLGVSVGQDATDALKDFTNGLGRGSTEVLDNLGIILRAEEAHKLYASSVGKTVSELSDLEKRQAVVTLGLKRGAEAAAKAKIEVDGWAASWERAKVALGNVADDVVQVDKNVKALSDETLKSLGLTGDQAARATSNLADSLTEGLLDAVTFGNARIVRSFTQTVDDLGGKTEELAVTIQRGQPSYNILIDFMRQSGTAAERAEKVFTKLGRAIGTLADKPEFERAALAEELRELQSTRFVESGRKARDKIRDDEIKDREKRRKKGGKNAADAARQELQLNINAATRERAIVEQRFGLREARVSEVIAKIDEQLAAERELAEFQLRTAKSRGDQLRAVGSIENSEHQANLARMAATRQERETLLALEQKAMEAHRAFVSTTRAQELSQLQRRNELERANLDVQATAQLRGVAPGDAQQVQEIQGLARVKDDVSAREEAREVRLEQIEFEMLETDDRLERMRLEEEAAQINHEASLDRVRVQQAVESQALSRERRQTKERIQLRQNMLRQSLSFAQGMAGAATQIVRAEKKAAQAAREAGESEAAARAKARGEGLVSLGQDLQARAIGHAVQAVASFATFNFVGGAGHIAAALALGIGARTVIGIGNSLLAKGGGSGGGAGALAGGIGGGGGTGGGGASAASGPGADTGPIPPSPQPGAPRFERRGDPQPGNPAGGAANGPPGPQRETKTVNITAEFNAISIDRAAARDIREKLDELASEETG